MQSVTNFHCNLTLWYLLKPIEKTLKPGCRLHVDATQNFRFWVIAFNLSFIKGRDGWDEKDFASMNLLREVINDTVIRGMLCTWP